MCINDELKEIKKDLRSYHDQNQKIIIAASDNIPPSFSPILQGVVSTLVDVSKKLSDLVKYNETQDQKTTLILNQVQKTNGRVTKIELWKAKLKGASSVLKGVWGILGVFVVASIFGIFQMYLAINRIETTIHNEVQKEFVIEKELLKN